MPTKVKNKIVKEFLEYIEPIQEKNRGGCLFICYMFYLTLKEKKLRTKSFSIIQLGKFEDTNIKANLDFISNKANVAKSDSHFVWTYKGKIYDSRGELSEEDLKIYPYRKDLPLKNIDVFCKNALINGGWNHWFDRNEAIDEYFSHFDLEDLKV